ncbi:hypothetical protein [Streptomyces sp. NRRL F-4428]|nr:hypothetical protein [Streptomyces sp. NRRL F-4428]
MRQIPSALGGWAVAAGAAWPARARAATVAVTVAVTMRTILPSL